MRKNHKINRSNRKQPQERRTTEEFEPSPREKRSPEAPENDFWKRELKGVILITLAFITLLSLYTYHSGDASLSSSGGEGTRNLLGPFGAYLSDILRSMLGIGAYFIPLALFIFSLRIFMKNYLKIGLKNVCGFLGLIVTIPTLFGLLKLQTVLNDKEVGGALGRVVSGFMIQFFSYPGAIIITIAVLIASTILMFRISICYNSFKILFKGFALLLKGVYLFLKGSARMGHKLNERLQAEIHKIRENQKSPAVVASKTNPLPPGHIPIYRDDPAMDPLNHEAEPLPEVQLEMESEDFELSSPPLTSQAIEAALIDITRPVESTNKARPEFFKRVNRNGYKLPSLDLLDPTPEKVEHESDEELKRMAALLEEKLLDYKVEGEVVKINAGPVVTMFEYRPKKGTRISTIASLASDLSMALSALDIRIIAPIPGKDVVGIEIPNRNREIVTFREIMESAEFNKKKSKLAIALGKDIIGKAIFADLAEMPHLLMAGTTGSGKSIGLHCIISSLLYRYTPEELKIILIDPKINEFNYYKDIPHLLLPIINDPQKANLALRWAVSEMDQRYQRFSDHGAINLESYNNAIQKITSPGEEGQPLPEKLPLIVIIIDEFADLMMASSKETETSIIRLAQKARACGIHIIIATQRPSVDVITGLINSNFPSRIAFKVYNQMNSKIILDTGGAEKLLGKGDMLFKAPSSSSLIRVHGAYISENEIRNISQFLKQQGAPEYNMDILLKQEEEETAMEEGIEDALYLKAVEIVRESGRASISYVQRRLGIGYNRAAKMVEHMERQGVISPPAGNKQIREIYLS